MLLIIHNNHHQLESLMAGANANLNIGSCCIVGNSGGNNLFYVDIGSSINCDEYCYIETNGLGIQNAQTEEKIVDKFINKIPFLEIEDCPLFIQMPFKWRFRITCACPHCTTPLDDSLLIIVLSEASK